MLWSTGIKVGPRTQKEWQEQEEIWADKAGSRQHAMKVAGGEEAWMGRGVFPWSKHIFTFKELFNGTAWQESTGGINRPRAFPADWKAPGWLQSCALNFHHSSKSTCVHLSVVVLFPTQCVLEDHWGNFPRVFLWKQLKSWTRGEQLGMQRPRSGQLSLGKQPSLVVLHWGFYPHWCPFSEQPQGQVRHSF